MELETTANQYSWRCQTQATKCLWITYLFDSYICVYTTSRPLLILSLILIHFFYLIFDSGTFFKISSLILVQFFLNFIFDSGTLSQPRLDIIFFFILVFLSRPRPEILDCLRLFHTCIQLIKDYKEYVQLGPVGNI